MKAKDQQRARRLRELRERHHLTRADVAKAIGASERIIYGWEHGEHTPSGGHLRALAELYDVSPGYIANGVEDLISAPEVRSMVEQNKVMLTRIDERVAALWEYVQKVQQVQLPPEQAAALSWLEHYTEGLGRTPQPTPPRRARRGSAGGTQAAQRHTG